jgi:hypothetical protein
VEKRIQEKLPQLFQDNLMCAGLRDVGKGACKGVSGSPLMYFDILRVVYVQIATVHGGIGDCGHEQYPGIFVRLDHPSIWNFIASTINPLPEEQTQISLTGEEEYTTEENIQ